MDLLAKIRTIPPKPGCYLYKNAEGEVIYVGKAKNLRSRVRSYFLEASQANAKTGSLMREAVDVEYITVDNEREALALENNLIKQRKPRFNILLRDDKTYPYIKLTMGDRYPKVFVTRKLRKDGGQYFGPYFPGNLAHRLVDLIHRSFLIPSCKVDLSRYHPRACLQFYIKRCLGPCVDGHTTPDIYKQTIRDVQLFLEGRPNELEKRLNERMAEAAENMQFELAARLRDQIVTVHQAQDKQRIASADDEDADVFGFHFENEMLAVNLFHMRGGKIVDRRDFFWEDLPDLHTSFGESLNEGSTNPEEASLASDDSQANPENCHPSQSGGSASTPAQATPEDCPDPTTYRTAELTEDTPVAAEPEDLPCLEPDPTRPAPEYDQTDDDPETLPGRSPIQQTALAELGPAFSPANFFSALLKQLYLDQPYVPRSIYVPVDFPDRALLAEELSLRTRTPHRARRPQARRQALPRRPRLPERQAVLRPALPRPSAHPARHRPGPRASPQPARHPHPHRVLRHLPHPGRRHRRLHGRLGRRRHEKSRLPQVPGQNRLRRRRLRLHARDHPPPLPPPPGRQKTVSKS